MTSGELVASCRQIDGQRDKGKHPTAVRGAVAGKPQKPDNLNDG
jgi:hypothetical protein